MIRQVQGIIVRRNCMGKKLSFADVRCCVVDDDHDDDKAAPSEQEANDADTIVKVAFRRQASSAWSDEESVTPFPIKTSDLPYGALVSLQLQPAAAAAEDATTTTNNNLPPYEVISWQLLRDPKQAAEALASVGQDHGGMLYSTYLRERGNRFWTTTKGQRMAASTNNLQQQQQQQPPLKERDSSDKDNDNDPSSAAQTKRPRTRSPSKKLSSAPATSSTTNMNNDDLQSGGHGDKVAKTMRARLFAQWLLDTYGAASLQRGSGVLDVAGGKGHLSIELAASGRVPCTVVDPMIRKQQQSFPVKKRDAKRIRKAGGPLPQHLPTFFNQTSFLEQYGASLSSSTSTTGSSGGDTTSGKEEDTNPPSNSCVDDNDDPSRFLIANASILVGLHPDQTTQDILEIALRYDKNVAIVPCCVFPSFFPMRLLHDGSPVVTHAQFCQYLLSLDPSLQQTELPFQGRNVVIYRTSANKKPET